MISEIEIIPEKEKYRLLYDFNNTKAEYPEDRLVHQLFEEQSERAGDKIAVISMEHGVWSMEGTEALEKRHAPCSLPHAVTYNELSEKSNQLARLLNEKGIQPDGIAGIMVERSVEMVIGILSILKAGGAYLPIDPDYPVKRIHYMLADSSAGIVLTTKNLSERIAFKREIIFLDSFKEFGPEGASSYTLHAPCAMRHASSKNSAYIIYTSGTTGEPKGTVVEHRSLVNLCTWHHRYYQVTDKDIAIQYAGIGFDASVWEVFPYLTIGAVLHIISTDIRLDIDALNQYFEKHCVTIAFLPTPVCHQFIKQENRSLHKLLTGGDKLQHFNKRNYELYNNYGPTENTVVTTAYPVTEPMENIPIGRPVFNTQVYILPASSRGNAGFQLQPVGIPGELCIAGDSLSRGYLNRPELTNDKFDQDLQDDQDDQDEKKKKGTGQLRLIKDSNMSYTSCLPYLKRYRTGDLCRWLSDGSIEFLGRMDQQVKIRGFRIELREIENRLLTHESVKDAVVIDREGESGDKYLCAYIVNSGIHREPDAGAPAFEKATITRNTELKEYISQTLPDYMIPSYFVFMDRMPMTPNGKIDRKALPVPKIDPHVEYVAPRNDTEKQLIEIWAEILEMDKNDISIEANFFDLGGNSLKIITVTGKLKETFKQDIPVVIPFRYSTIRALARYLRTEESDKGETPNLRVEERNRGKNKQRRLKQRRKLQKNEPY